MAGPRVVVVANCAAGAGSAMEERTRVILDAFSSTRVVPEVRCVVGPDIERVARQIAAEAPAALAAAGGDGTVSAVAAALVGTDVPLGVLPLGTLNHFAKDVGVPLDPAQAAGAVVAGHAIRVDVARVNERTFLNNSSIGLYPQVVRARDARRKEVGGSKRAATLRSTWTLLRDMPLARLVLSIDGRDAVVPTAILFIGNNAYKLEGLGMGTRASLQQGTLTVVHTRRTGRLALAALALRAFVGALDGARELTLEEATSVRVDAPRGQLRIALDGEVFAMRPPLHFRSLPGALRVLVPQAAPP